MRIYLVMSLVISLLAVAFALVNNDTVTVNVGVATFQGSLALVILVTLFLGVLVGILASLPGRIRARRRARSLEQSPERERGKPSSSASERFRPPSETDA